MLIDMNNDGHVDIVQNAAFLFNCGFVGVPAGVLHSLVGPIVLIGRGGNAGCPGPKAWPHVQYRSTAIDANVTRAARHQGVARLPHAGAAGHGARSAARTGGELHLRGERRRGTQRAGEA